MLAKSIFKAASGKVASVRNATKVLTQQRTVLSMGYVQGVRMFANNVAVEKSVQKLSRALDKEIKYENENYSQLEDIETFLNESGFKFTEQDNGT